MGCQNQPMQLTELNVTQRATRLARLDRTPMGRLRRRLVRIAVRSARVFVGLALVTCVLLYVDYRQTMPQSPSGANAVEDLFIDVMAVGVGGCALVAAWFIALGHGPTIVGQRDQLHARARRSIQWNNWLERMPDGLQRLISAHGLLTKGMPAVGAVVAVVWMYTLQSAPAGAAPKIGAALEPGLRISPGLLEDVRPLPVARDKDPAAANNTPLHLRLEDHLRRSQR